MSEHKLTARASKASSESASNEEGKVPLNHSPSVEPIRFSARNTFESEGSSTVRIVIFVAVVIVLGVGLTFLIQNFVANRNSQTAAEASSSSSVSAAIKTDFLDIEATAVADSSAAKMTSNDMYTTSNLSLGSANNVATGTQITRLTHTIYDTFTNTSWTVTSGGTGLPATNISYNSSDNTITVKFTSLDVADASISGPFDIASGNVQKISATKAGADTTFTLQLAAPSKYYAYVVGGTTLALDIKTEAALTQPVSSSSSSSVASSEISSSSSSSVTSSSSSSVASGTTNYDNTYSQNKQSVVSSVTGNTLYNDTYYYIDYGDSFQFSWALRNTGPESIPNATAEMVTDNGVYYVKVTINNLAQDILAIQNKTKATITIPVTASNLVDVTRESTTNGTSVYMVQLRHAGNFRLHSTLTYNNYQLLSLQIAD